MVRPAKTSCGDEGSHIARVQTEVGGDIAQRFAGGPVNDDVSDPDVSGVYPTVRIAERRPSR